MRNILILAILISVISACNNNKGNGTSSESIEETGAEEIITGEFGHILDSLSFVGSILIYDEAGNKYYSNDFEWANTGYIPASTFKIPNTIIALETGVVEDENSISYWNGKKRNMETWEKDLTLKEAFKVSCVPCYQEFARNIGVQRMRDYLDRFDYGNMVFDSTNIDNFWLEGDSKISQMEQIGFLKKFNNSGLQISERTGNIMKKIMEEEKTDKYILSSKTGWAARVSENVGWYVGFVTHTNGNTYFFATNVQVSPSGIFDMDNFTSYRISATRQALKFLNII